MDYAKITQGIRQRIFDYPPELQEKASRVLHRAKVLKIKQNPRVKPAWEREGRLPPGHWATGPV